MSESAIVVENLHKSFKGGRYEVLKGLNAEFPRGDLTYVLGPSGTGKSVLIKNILGLLRPEMGSIRVEGVDVNSLDQAALMKYRLRFGVLFQNSALFDDLSVFENVAFPLREHTEMGDLEIRDLVVSTLEHLGMNEGYDKLPSELSGGMRKRVGLARAIVRKPSILLYDEPTTGLDPVTRTTVDELIEKIKNELRLTSIVISHDIPSALLLADRIIFLFGGQAVFSGPPSEFRKAVHPAIRDFLKAEQRSLSALS